MTISRVKDTPV